MAAVSKIVFGRMAGISRNTVYKHCNSGVLLMRPDGKIELTSPANADYLRLRKEKAEAGEVAPPPPYVAPPYVAPPVLAPEIAEPIAEPAAEASDTVTFIKPKKPKKKAKPKPPIIPTGYNYTELPGNLEDITEGEMVNLRKADLDRIKVMEDILAKRQKREAERNELVKRDFVHRAFSKLYDIHMNEFLTLKEKMVPDLAAALGVNDNLQIVEAGKIMDTELWRTLDHIKIEFQKFLKGINADPL